ncbi:ribonuclease P protein subunit p40 [Anguilla anguilla]|uniref:ribonuclease P protein subunit p40 n=1 Tax=Anguilla anguilla TaxID=7936 RepID=UPI0015B148C2|nr:ribonuclease P protein subunit p40 [Anguilla anguilla]
MFTNLEKCPRNLLICEKSSFLNEKSRHATHVAKHFFNYKVSVLIPECGIIPSGLRSVVSSFSKYYLLKNLPVYKLLEEEFLEKVVKKGCLYALSYKTRIDQDNTFALLPTGQVILSVDKDTYEELGLEGKASQYNHRQPMRYVVTIDLTDKSMAAGGKRYKRVMWALQEKVQLTSDFLLARYSTGGDGEDLLQSFFSQYSSKELKPSISSQTFKNLLCPSLDPTDLRGDTRSCDPQQFLEWLGAVTMDISCNNEAASFVSAYCCPEPQSSVSQALLCTTTGLLLPEDIHSLLEELRRYFDEPRFTSWLSVTVHGFADSPVSWGGTEHGFHKGGENFYTFVLFKNQDYWLHMATGANDGCPP